jgi:hypothetical protein
MTWAVYAARKALNDLPHNAPIGDVEDAVASALQPLRDALERKAQTEADAEAAASAASADAERRRAQIRASYPPIVVEVSDAARSRAGTTLVGLPTIQHVMETCAAGEPIAGVDPRGFLADERWLRDMATRTGYPATSKTGLSIVRVVYEAWCKVADQAAFWTARDGAA